MVKHISTSDCLPFSQIEATSSVIEKFIATQSDKIFWLSHNDSDEDSKLAEYDYKTKSWRAGRFIGEAYFEHDNTSYKITIKPRFGEKALLYMLEEIFNIRITTSSGSPNQSNDWQHFIKRIIAFIWIQKLANANLHGFPKVQKVQTTRGNTVRGRIDIRKSIIPYKTTNEVVSRFTEKQIDQSIASILYEAYQILKKEFNIGSVNLPDSAQDALNHIFAFKAVKHRTSTREYQNIKYKEIYTSWKPIVDLSWDIIQNKQMNLQQENTSNGFGFFLDMAEIWEQYLRSILKKKLAPLGWHYKNPKLTAYQNYFFQRTLIPDLVFQKDDKVAIWDAKYKRMLSRSIDVDRADFFQIHTYIQNFSNLEIKTGGLLYPITNSRDSFSDHRSPYLINEDGRKMTFAVDGIEYSEISETINIKDKESEFLERITTDLIST